MFYTATSNVWKSNYRLLVLWDVANCSWLTTCLSAWRSHWNGVSFCAGVKLFSDITYLFTLWSRVLPEKLTVPQLVIKFPAFYGTRRFITAFTRTSHLSLFYAKSIQSMLPHPTYRRSISILSSHLCLGLRSGLLSSGFPTRTLYSLLLLPIHATYPANLSFLELITRIIFGYKYRAEFRLRLSCCVNLRGRR